MVGSLCPLQFLVNIRLFFQHEDDLIDEIPDEFGHLGDLDHWTMAVPFNVPGITGPASDNTFVLLKADKYCKMFHISARTSFCGN